MSNAFYPISATQSTTVIAAATAVTLNAAGDSIRVFNDGTNVVWIQFGNASDAPVAVVGTAHIAMIGNTVEVFLLPPGTTKISVIASATGNTLRTTVGSGQ